MCAGAGTAPWEVKAPALAGCWSMTLVANVPWLSRAMQMGSYAIFYFPVAT